MNSPGAGEFPGAGVDASGGAAVIFIFVRLLGCCYLYVSNDYQMKQTTARDLAKTNLFHLCSTLGSVQCLVVVGSRLNLVISS